MDNNSKQSVPESRRKITFRSLVVFLVVFALVFFTAGVLTGVGFNFGRRPPIIKGLDPDSSEFGAIKNINGEIPDYFTKDVDFELFWDVWDLIKKRYYQKRIPETQLFYGALKGMVDSLNDPYSVFFTPVNSNDFQEEIKGNFEGIGAEIGIRNSQLTIIAPLPDSPAFQAGLRPRDIVLKVDGQDVSELSLIEAVDLIRGKKGTEVVLTVYRENFAEPKDISIIRDAISVKSLTWEFLDNEIAYLKARQFNGETISLFNQAILDILSRPKTKGIILDLRNNPGGYLNSAIEMAGEWINGETVVIEKLRDDQVKIHRADKKARLAGYPTVILINGGTASGSEIVAGALQDWDEAVVVGETTFGKGSVQSLIELDDGSAVKLTIAKWFTPNNRSIEEEGIEPDFLIEMAEEDYNNFLDPQLERAKEIIINN